MVHVNSPKFIPGGMSTPFFWIRTVKFCMPSFMYVCPCEDLSLTRRFVFVFGLIFRQLPGKCFSGKKNGPHRNSTIFGEKNKN